MPALTNPEVSKGFTHVYKFDYLDLQTTGFLSTLGAANQKIIASVPPGGIVELCAVINLTAEAGTSDLTLDVGVTSSDPDEFIDNLDLDGLTYASFNTGDASVGTVSGAATTTNVVNGYINNTSSAKSVYMEVNGTHASLTAGEWIIGLKITDLLSAA